MHKEDKMVRSSSSNGPEFEQTLEDSEIGASWLKSYGSQRADII